MPLLRSTMCLALEGLPPTMPRTASIWSLATGASGRKEEVRVRKTSTLILVHALRAGARGQFEPGFDGGQPTPHQGAQQPLEREADRDDGEDQRQQEKHIQQQHGIAPPLALPADGTQQLAPYVEAARARLLADQQARVGLDGFQAGEQR